MSVAPRVWVAKQVLQTIAVVAHRHAPLETGGLLLGYHSADQEAVITHALGPGPDADHGHEDYVPDYGYDRVSAIAWWEQTGGTEYYLGDWHSHPKADLYLSDRDREVLEVIAHNEESLLPRPLMMVLGLEPSAQLGAWRYLSSSAGETDPESCEIVLFDEP